ncbi:pentapeptide repeat-containing protein [Thalassospira lucentensis]|uniref:Pentapeptide repeat-containing protein n=1 Tax=Thalassospira lucentensis TaxID=168935 RepID=A0A358HV74_9PROT|nr:pentapeptide repeat-containing protein [Thalassospira lucentensis]HBU99066.1 hypothetical protein [Thalassospira lucentensis]HCW69970.1 hypothetical protein [Thalassospira lucentensis]
MPMLSGADKEEAIQLGNQQNWEELLKRGKDAWNTWAEHEISKTSDKIPCIEFRSQNQDLRKITTSDFNGFKFPCPIFFNKIKFSRNVRFSECEFQEDLNFLHCRFEKSSLFSGTEFRGLFFDDVTFCGETDLSSVDFYENTEILNTTFESEVVFSHSTFHKELNLYKTNFNQTVLFHKTTFKKSVTFRANFKGYTSFHQAAFCKESDFSTSIFDTTIIFDESQFIENVTFSQSHFKSFIYFQGTEFHKEAKFTKSIIKGQLSFKPKIVKQQVSFSGASFSEHADFSGTQFDGDVIFTDTHFEKSALFSNCYFQKEAIFLRTVFAGYTSFENSSFSDQTCPNFRSTVFLETRSPELYGTSIKYQVSEECPCHKILNICKYDDGYERYRILKKMAAQNHNHDDEVYYFSLEMKAKRHHLHKYTDLSKFVVLAFNHAYGALSDFGQSIVRPLTGLLLTALFFAYSYSGLLAQNWLERLLLVAKFESAIWTAVAINLFPFAGQVSIGRDVAKKQLCPTESATPDCMATLYKISTCEGVLAFIFLFLIGLALRNIARIK